MKRNFQRVNIISDVIGEYLINIAKINARGKNSYKKKYLYPSMDFLCPTKAYFNFKYSGGNYLELQVDEDYSYEGERAKENGNKVHECLQEHFKGAKILKLNELTLVDEDKKIKARLDSVVEIKNQLYLVEIKSSKNYSIKLMVDQEAPDIEHQKQIQLYFHLIEKNKHLPEIQEVLQGRPLNKGILYYENKDNQKPTEFLVVKNNIIIEELLNYTDIVWDHINRKQKPEFKYDSESPECLYKCSSQFYKICHGKDRITKKDKEIIEDKGIWGIADARNLAMDEKFF